MADGTRDLWKKLSASGVCDFYTAKLVRIDEPRLGLAKYALQAIILIFFIIQGVFYEPYLVTEVPTGSAVFWGTSDPRELAKAQSYASLLPTSCLEPHAPPHAPFYLPYFLIRTLPSFVRSFFAGSINHDYCKGVSYGDTFCRLTSLNQSCAGPPPYPGCDGIFCEYNIVGLLQLCPLYPHSPETHHPNASDARFARSLARQGCASLPFSEINMKMPTEMFFMTIIKDWNQVIAGCGPGDQQLDENSCSSDNGWTFQVINETLGSSGLCSCHRMQNIFPKGVETIDLTVSHTIKVRSRPYPTSEFDLSSHDARFALVQQTSQTNLRDFRGKGAVNLPTTVYAYDELGAFSRGKKIFSLGHGDRIQRSIGDWLSVLGLDSLDEHNAVGALGRPTVDPENMDGNLVSLMKPRRVSPDNP